MARKRKKEPTPYAYDLDGSDQRRERNRARDLRNSQWWKRRVAKGICHMRKQMVLADGQACPMFEKLPKCKHCAKYTPGEEAYLGTCAAWPSKPMTYPDLIGVTCEHFSWVEDR